MNETQFLQKFDSFFITSHLNPDGDAIGCEVALAAFLEAQGKTVWVVNDEPVPILYRFLPNTSRIQTREQFKSAAPFFEAAIFLECGSKSRAGRSGGLVGKKPILNIDHHGDNTLYGLVNIVHPEVSACGEIVYRIIQRHGKISQEIATALYTAILTDTLSFRFHTRPQTLRAAASLIEKGADSSWIAEQVFEQVPFPALLLLSKSLATLKQALGGLVTYCRLERRMFAEVGAEEGWSEGFIDYLRVVAGSRITFLLKELPDGKTRVNLRAKGDCDIQKIAARFGGGGHKSASGCTLNASLDEAEKLILTEIKKALEMHGE